MNEITNETEVPFDLDMVEILDEQGNPTGQYRPREAALAEVTLVPAEDADHVVA